MADGVLVVDKPAGITSHDVVAVARRGLRERRIGHTGTLDPLATGVLPLACGRATRLVRFLMASDKDYLATIRFGVETNTYDITGTTVTIKNERPTCEAVVSAIAGLTGGYRQMPPAFSAKNIGGTRAYALARREAPVELTAVPVHVARADLVHFDGNEAVVTLTCSAGFYVRSFAHELGRVVGAGACLSGLQRTRSGDFSLSEAVGIADIQTEDALTRLIPLERLLPRFPVARLTEEGYHRAAHGRELEPVHVESEDGRVLTSDAWVRLLAPDGHLVALATALPRAGALHPSVVLV